MKGSAHAEVRATAARRLVRKLQKSGPAGLREQAKGVVDEWRAAVDREQAAGR